MGLNGLGGGSVQVSDLAKKTANSPRDVAANVLLLHLDGSSISVSAPDPISSVKTTEPAGSIVFNSNYSRENFGKHVTSTKISKDSEKASLLLDSNMNNVQRAIAIISSLEFDEGLSVVKDNITDSDFTNDLSEPNLDNFNEYPESIFVNSAELNSTTKQRFIFDAIVASKQAMDGLGNSDLALQSVTTLDIAESEINSSNMATGKYIAARAGLDHTAVDSMTQLAGDAGKMDTVANSNSAKGDIRALPLALDKISANNSATAKMIAVSAGLSPSNFTDINNVVADNNAMDTIASSTSGMESFVRYESALDAASSEQTALDAFGRSSIAMDTIVASNSVRNVWTPSYFKSEWTKHNLSDGESPPIADLYYTEVGGGGGGTGNTNGNERGENGQDSSFGDVIGEGGPGGLNSDQLTGVNPGAQVSNKARLIEEVIEGANNGGTDSGSAIVTGDGGGLAKALQFNPDGNTISASIGGGGDDWDFDGPDEGGGGEDGFVNVWVPPA
jgi:hypothetical protein